MEFVFRAHFFGVFCIKFGRFCKIFLCETTIRYQE